MVHNGAYHSRTNTDVGCSGEHHKCDMEGLHVRVLALEFEWAEWKERVLQ